MYSEIKENSDLWDLFTKKEEYQPIKLDKEGRFSYKFSKHKNPLNPEVSKFLLKKGYNAIYPDEKKFALCLTHDVDDVYIKFKDVIRSPLNFIRYGNFNGYKHLLKGYRNKSKSPYINFDKIIELEKKYNAISTFFFLADPNDRFGYKYKIEDLSNELNNIMEKDCEIAYHTGYYIYENSEDIEKEKEKLEQIIGKQILGARNHVLRFKTPDSWNVLANAGIKYDTSYHYHDMVGFRNGMCHPFYPFDQSTNKKIDILEIPLTLSDIALRSFMKKNVKKSWEYIKKIIDVTEKNNGVVTILWHNWTFSYPVSAAGWFGKGWTELYEKILKYCSEKNAWITNCKEIYNYEKNFGILKSD